MERRASIGHILIPTLGRDPSKNRLPYLHLLYFPSLYCSVRGVLFLYQAQFTIRVDHTTKPAEFAGNTL